MVSGHSATIASQVIGDAARGVSQSLKDCHPEVPWPQIVALRNILVHELSSIPVHPSPANGHTRPIYIFLLLSTP